MVFFNLPYEVTGTGLSEGLPHYEDLREKEYIANITGIILNERKEFLSMAPGWSDATYYLDIESKQTLCSQGNQTVESRAYQLEEDRRHPLPLALGQDTHELHPRE